MRNNSTGYCSAADAVETWRDTAGQRGDNAMTTDTAGDKAEDAAEKAQHSRPFGALVVVGLVAYGVIHLAVAWIALQLAWGGSGQQADQQGAMQQLAAAPFGTVLLWLVAIGLFALVLWRLGLAVWGFSWKGRRQRFLKRTGSIGQAIVYGALGVSAVGVATGSSGGGGGQSISARLMQNPYGRVALALVAAAIIGAGIFLCVKGIGKRFVDELQDGGTRPVILLGRIGYVAKGIAYAVVGLIIGWAAFRHNAAQAGGLDAALRTVKDQPYGPFLLSALAAGLACFGLYCFGWARRPRKS
jgi:hypothetical protein